MFSGCSFILILGSHVKVVSVLIFFPDFFLDFGVHFNVKDGVVDAVTYLFFGVLAVDVERLVFAGLWQFGLNQLFDFGGNVRLFLEEVVNHDLRQSIRFFLESELFDRPNKSSLIKNFQNQKWINTIKPNPQWIQINYKINTESQ